MTTSGERITSNVITSYSIHYTKLYEKAADAATPTPTTEPEPTYDFGGRVLKIGSYYDMTPDPEKSALSEAFAA